MKEMFEKKECAQFPEETKTLNAKGKKIFISIRPPRERDIQNIIIYTHHLFSFVFRVGTRERSARIFLSEKERERDALTFLLEREDAE